MKFVDILINVSKKIMEIVKIIFRWIFTHKKITFIYFPLVCFILVSIYTGIIYMQWLADRDDAFKKLSRYKQLIDKTEEIKKGMVYSYSDVDLKGKVVDIPTRIYDRNGEVIGEFFEEKREIVPYDQIPDWVKKGVVASEDRDFYKHNGVNYKGILRAMIKNMIKMRFVQGGSTVTQQLAKVLFTDMERSIKRKVYELFCARAIEERYDKEDILSMYLNLIYFGNGAYGVESISKMYFGKRAKDCTAPESAMIVATISNPRVYSPLNNLRNSVRKTKRIMKSLVDAGYMTQQVADYQYKEFLKKWDVQFDEKSKKSKSPVAKSSLIGSFLYSSYRVNRAPFFNERIRRLMVKKFGETTVKKGGLSVYTTIDGKMQDFGREALRRGVTRQRDYHKIKARKNKRNRKIAKRELINSENIEGALVSIDPHSGEIYAYVGGYRFSSKNQMDHVAQIRRQPGSSFKPLIYCSAVEEGTITPATVIKDEATTFEGGWSPKNYSFKFFGDLVVREALRRSINMIAIKVLNRTKYDKIFEYLENILDFDSSTLNKRFGKTLSMALGTYELSPLENVRIHSTIANGGDYVLPYGIKYVKDYNGNIVWNNEEDVVKKISDKREKGKVIDPRAAAITVNMLKGALQPGGTAGRIPEAYKIKFEVAGKTGTSTNWNDAWFAGYTSKLVTVVWVGNKRGAISLGRGRSGGSISAPIWGEFISKSFRDSDEQPEAFKVPEEGLTSQEICLDSGMVPTSNCPRTSVELFYAGTEPGEYCTMHPETESGASEDNKTIGDVAAEEEKKSDSN